jgi:hypothetical protein
MRLGQTLVDLRDTPFLGVRRERRRLPPGSAPAEATGAAMEVTK